MLRTEKLMRITVKWLTEVDFYSIKSHGKLNLMGAILKLLYKKCLTC